MKDEMFDALNEKAIELFQKECDKTISPQGQGKPAKIICPGSVLSSAPGRWIPVTERLPTKEEYTAKAEDGTEYYVRLLIAYKTDIVEYEIGYYDGYKWMTEMPIRIIKDVVAWMPFPNLPQPPKGE